MEIWEGNYNGKKRVVIKTKETDSWFEGYDIGYLEKDEDRKTWRDKVKDIDMSKLTEEQQTEEYGKLKELMRHFRRFSKAKVEK